MKTINILLLSLLLAPGFVFADDILSGIKSTQKIPTKDETCSYFDPAAKTQTAFVVTTTVYPRTGWINLGGKLIELTQADEKVLNENGKETLQENYQADKINLSITSSEEGQTDKGIDLNATLAVEANGKKQSIETKGFCKFGYYENPVDHSDKK